MAKKYIKCGSFSVVKKGKQNGHQKWYCKSCKSYFSGTQNTK